MMDIRKYSKGFLFLIITFLIIPQTSFAIFDSAAQIPYLAQILAENIKQYQKLKSILEQGKNNEELLRTVNRGLDNAYGLLKTMPIKDEKILQDIRNFENAYKNVKSMYGDVKNGTDNKMFELHDKTVAESITMASSLSDYASTQEENSKKLFVQSESASPKGAARMNVQINSQILHTLSQLLKVNGQLLKLQSEMMGVKSKEGKEAAEHYDKIKNDMKGGILKPKNEFHLPKLQ
ncbi:MAG: hypothetical protein HQK49_21835 [Oligoflexia bacterium]|nr:hypothetical protein [Oligoflexia bacterium]